MIQMKNSSWWKKVLRKEEFAVVIHDYENPLSEQLPRKLEVGEKIDLLLPYNGECLLHKGWSHVGISDYFGRTHWARRKDVTEANKKWQKDFAKDT